MQYAYFCSDTMTTPRDILIGFASSIYFIIIIAGVTDENFMVKVFFFYVQYSYMSNILLFAFFAFI
jgi:hypothetical protein